MLQKFENITYEYTTFDIELFLFLHFGFLNGIWIGFF